MPVLQVMFKLKKRIAVDDQTPWKIIDPDLNASYKSMIAAQQQKCQQSKQQHNKSGSTSTASTDTTTAPNATNAIAANHSSSNAAPSSALTVAADDATMNGSSHLTEPNANMNVNEFSALDIVGLLVPYKGYWIDRANEIAARAAAAAADDDAKQQVMSTCDVTMYKCS